ncbi:acyl--CoA ligase [Pendulispora albinea]|uniref:Acyl--CoA ligase n=1 Tax=Pendulispora albinea TaxID=2741071 RepID=A0ABZ2LXJ1_9BACT
MSTLYELLAGEDDQPALLAPGKPMLTYGQLRRNVREIASQLNQLGLGRGDRIALAMINGPELITTFFGIATAATAAPLNPKYKQDEFAFYYEDTAAKALVTLSGSPIPAAMAAALPGMKLLSVSADENGYCGLAVVSDGSSLPPPDPKPEEVSESDDVAMILHTSGTTSRPKRVPLRHRNLVASANNIRSTYDLGPSDRTLCVMPLFHIHGIVGSMLSTLSSGGSVVCPPGFNAMEFLSLIESFSPTWYSAVPTMHQMVLARVDRHAEQLRKRRLRFIRSSSAPMPPVVRERLEQCFNAPVLDSYGMTEASHQMASNPLPPRERKAGTVGYGHGVEVRIMDEAGHLLAPGEIGEVVVRGPNVVDGYENNPEANLAAYTNGWFRTGDQGVLDADGYLSLTGRIKELINRGGEKVSPLEIDDVLLRHPAVAEALAFAVPHKMLGEEIHAAVVLKDPVEGSELRAHCAEALAEYKVPKRFHVLTEIPRGATGKLQRINMAKLLKIGAADE